MSKKKTLTSYQQQQDFSKSPEPKGHISSSHKQPIFVIQQHNARNLHYDFRLENDGVLTSWAIPKGPSTNPQVKHLAVQTEDHPLDYAHFEGVIPEGEYGAGQVLIWDRGTFTTDKDLNECIANGHITVFLNGEKLNGNYALIRTGYGKNSWLFFKMKDKYADKKEVVKEQPRSVVSGKIIEELK